MKNVCLALAVVVAACGLPSFDAHAEFGMVYGKRPVFSAKAVSLGKGTDGDLRFAVQLPPNDFPCFAKLMPSRDCRIRATLVGSHESLVVGESIFVAAPTNVPARPVNVGFGNILRRYAKLRKWPQKDITNDLVLFLSARAADGGDLALEPFDFFALTPGKSEPFLPERTFPVGRRAGALVFTHAATKTIATPTFAEYRIRYADGTDESVWVQSNWNCGYRALVGTGDQAAGGASTWWGPTGFPKAEALYEPLPGQPMNWTARYRSRYLVQCPEKEIRSVELRSDPACGFEVSSVEVVPPETTALGVIEAEEGATLTPGREETVDVMTYAAVPKTSGDEVEVFLEKRGGLRLPLGKVRMTRVGRLGWGDVRVRIPDDPQWTGPVRLVAGAAESSWLGLMPKVRPGDTPVHYSMITSGQLSYEHYLWIRRLGYDMVKTHTIGWGFDPDVWRRQIELILSAGVVPALRPSMGARYDVTNLDCPQAAYHPSKGDWTWKHDFAWDLGDAASREAVREYYRRITEILKTCPPMASIEPCYGVTRGVGAPGGALAPGAELWKVYLARLAKKFPGRDFSKLTIRDVWEDERDGLLEELVRTGVESNRALQDEVSEIVRKALPHVRQVFHAGWRDSEHIVDGRDFPGYLRLCAGLENGSLSDAAAERYSVSFEQWLAGRTFGLQHCDEGCANPPPYEHLRRAYLHMAAFQTIEGNYCRFSVGRPCAHDVAEIKPFAALLANAEYLPDPVGFARSFESGYAQVRDTVRKPRHSQVMGHHALINLCLGNAINPDRFVLDAFPEKDAAFTGRVLLDDLNVRLPDDFAGRIAAYVEKGGTYVVFADVDRQNGGAVLKRFGLSSDGKTYSGEDVRVAGRHFSFVRKAYGKGMVVGIEKPIVPYGWETTDIPSEALNEFRELVTGCGRFRPNARCEDPSVEALCYRAKDGATLLYLINVQPVAVRTRAGVCAELASAGNVFDYTTGRRSAAALQDGYRLAAVTLGPLSGTVMRFDPK